ncbi:hypothetical protein [Aequorivita antarctica]|uniref:hypothetical protein n=1 Tax=Aequorivita antarctica TaxID=153266 RepID=UPI000DBC232A|nr:hypothetical protein [Aequorivita antarctica]SRX73677.1 hypothetical protein AEQU3_01109 [Aequorivita antarctica]
MKRNAFNRNGKKFCGGLFFFLLLFLLPFAIQALWNGILPEIMNVSTITYWQAMGLFVLSRILFGGFVGGKHCGSKKRHFGKAGFKEKFMNMTDEEKAAFKERWKDRCGNNNKC